MLFFSSCKDSNKPDNNSSTVERISIIDSLLNDVIKGHDIAMPKIKKMERLNKEIKAVRDSLEKMPSNLKRKNQPRLLQLEKVLKNLDYAALAMEKWMNEFKYDSLKNKETERIIYLKGEKEKVNKMKDAVLNSISQGILILHDSLSTFSHR